MIKKLMLTACLVVAACVNGWACTNFIGRQEGFCRWFCNRILFCRFVWHVWVPLPLSGCRTCSGYNA